METDNPESSHHFPDETIRTPLINARYMAELIQRPVTPKHRGSSIGPGPSVPRPAFRTPTASRTIRQSRGGETAPLTPHALRALEKRRAAALTPGRARRRSGFVQRETPRDSLRTLSKLLARSTKPIEPSPKPPNLRTEEGLRLHIPEEFEKEADPPKPRVSLPLGEDDDDDDDDDDEPLPPPPQLSSEFDDDNYTIQSVEQPRRAASEQPFGRLSRASFGSLRLSDRFADLDDLSPGFGPGEDENMEMFQLRSEEILDSDPQYSDFQNMGMDDSLPLRDSPLGTRIVQAPRSSDIIPAIVPDGDEPSFAFELEQLPAEDFPFNNAEEESEAEDNAAGVIVPTPEIPNVGRKTRPIRMKRPLKVSKYGLEYPPLPPTLVRKLASTFSRVNGSSRVGIDKKTLDAVVRASDWFFEQISDDLGAYANHAGRKTIDDTDMVTLMKR
ncbi:hypothetical protein L228DRAFT_270573 [Xylona heveae TC161]|uniref:CENP-T/Histone H4 histone fold domain-containing protein n=1 Tax=Xylona heveae (strain CBS 132557 / TC161) TaxID=1328760 RepID=A0A165AHY9_XYLHT|nr:hypothetical protein L228DRAFT_270573 [Xylona heveae TC161]KZF20506.1 hypothetical protein L228DRAFT_270573 [Xylona heveae TC161]